MHKYSSINDPGRHTFESLALSEIEARVKVVTPLSSGFLIDEDFPYPFLGRTEWPSEPSSLFFSLIISLCW
jgi:hypothetical protein